jgi:hypothetical protein
MIRSLHSTHLVFTTQAARDSLGVSQYLLLSIAVIAVFGVAVFATGFVAKRARRTCSAATYPWHHVS